MSEGPSEGQKRLQRDGHRLLQVGGLLFLLGLLVGLAVPSFAVPRLGLSAHLLGIMQGTFLMVGGLLWPKLRFTGPVSRIARGLAIYGCLAAWTANLLGAMWGAGNSMLPMAAGPARGSAFQEGTIRALLMSAALSLVVVAVLILWGLRTGPRGEGGALRSTPLLLAALLGLPGVADTNPAQRAATPLSSPPTVDTLKAFLAAFNAHDLDAIMGFFAEDCELLMPRGAEPWGTRHAGKAAVREGLATRFAGVPDVHYGDDSHWVAGDRGVSTWLLTGTTKAGEALRVRGVDLLEFRDGKIIRKDSYWKIVQK